MRRPTCITAVVGSPLSANPHPTQLTRFGSSGSIQCQHSDSQLNICRTIHCWKITTEPSICRTIYSWKITTNLPDNSELENHCPEAKMGQKGKIELAHPREMGGTHWVRSDMCCCITISTIKISISTSCVELT